MGMGVEVGVSLGLGRGGLDMGASVVGHDGGFGIGISLDDGLHGPEAEHAAQYEGSMMASLGELSGFTVEPSGEARRMGPASTLSHADAHPTHRLIGISCPPFHFRPRWSLAPKTRPWGFRLC